MFVENVRLISEGLYLSGREAALHRRFQYQMNFGLIINCSNHCPFLHHPRVPGAVYLKCPIEDNLRKREIEKMTRWLPVLVRDIRSCLKERKRPVLVHCEMGRQRSATVVACYLLSERLVNTPEEGIAYVRKRKPDTFTNGANFQEALDSFYRQFEAIL